jgi:hypothetical protein
VDGHEVVAVGAGGRRLSVDLRDGTVLGDRSVGAACLSTPLLTTSLAVVPTYDAGLVAIKRYGGTDADR